MILLRLLNGAAAYLTYFKSMMVLDLPRPGVLRVWGRRGYTVYNHQCCPNHDDDDAERDGLLIPSPPSSAERFFPLSTEVVKGGYSLSSPGSSLIPRACRAPCFGTRTCNDIHCMRKDGR